MKVKKNFLTQDEYDALKVSDRWAKVELGLSAIQQTPGIQRKHDMLGGFVSGDANAHKMLNGQPAILGMDIIVYERKPKGAKGEGHINVYHYVVTKTGRLDLPFCLHGPYTQETLMGHWPIDLDLSHYEK